MNGWAIAAVLLALVLAYGVGYGTACAEVKAEIVQSFETFGFWTHKNTVITSSEVKTIERRVQHRPAPPPPEQP